MKNIGKRKIGRRGKIGLAVLVAVMFIGVATAALLDYYGKVETMVNVKQSVRLDGMVYSGGYGSITSDDEIGDIIGGSCEWGKNHWLYLHSGAQNPVDVEVDKSDPVDEFTTFIAGEPDTGPGTYVAPTSWNIEVPAEYTTITAAISAATSGQVIGVKAGTYDEQVVIDKGLTLAALEPGVTILDGVHITTSGVTVQGFTIGPVTLLGETWCVYLDGASNIEVSYNELDGAGVAGNPRGVLLVTGATYSNVLIANNVIHDLTTGIYTNPHTGTIDIKYNEIYNTVAGIGGITGANVRRNTFHDNGEAIGADNTYQSVTIKYNNFLGDDMVKNYGTILVIAHDNWWGYDGIDVEGNVDATWFEWQDGYIVELQPGERRDFKIQYCAVDNGAGEFTSSVSFLPTP